MFYSNRLISVVLYALDQDLWKIADFGSTAQGTSKRIHTTVFSRGTSSYRAPELLSASPYYNNKCDIWAFGCILYEIATGEKLFKDDFDAITRIHAGWDFQASEMKWPLLNIRNRPMREAFDILVETMLAKDYPKRPSSDELEERFTYLLKPGAIASKTEQSGKLLFERQLLIHRSDIWPNSIKACGGDLH